MKFIVIILSLLLPTACYAFFGYSFKDISLLAGKQYRHEQQPLNAFEIQYDKYLRACTKYTSYRGLGLKYSFNEYQREIGFKAMLNPTNIYFHPSRSSSFFPYLYLQGNMVQTKNQIKPTTPNNSINTFNYCPGIGITGRLFIIRTSIQLGYRLPINKDQKIHSPLTIELKLGIGINKRLLKIKKKVEVEAH